MFRVNIYIFNIIDCFVLTSYKLQSFTNTIWEREREEKIKRKTPKPKCGGQCTLGKNLLFYNIFTTHYSSEKEKFRNLFVHKKKKNIRERESEKPITIGEDNTVCINQWAPSPVFRCCCHCSWCRLNENKFDLKTKWSVKKLLFIVFPELFFFFFLAQSLWPS